MRNKLAYMVTVLMLFAGCIKPHLVNNMGHIRIDLIWNDPDTDIKPANLSINFYSEKNYHPFNLNNTANFLFDKTLPEGKYTMLAFNTDHQNINIEGVEDYSSASAMAIPLDAENTKSSSLFILQPASFFCYSLDETNAMEVTNATISSIDMELKNYIKQIKISVVLTGDKDLVSGATVSLSGVANGVNLLTGLPFSDTGKNNIVIASNISLEDFSTTLRLFGTEYGAGNELAIDLSFEDSGSQRIDKYITDNLLDLSEDSQKEFRFTIHVDRTLAESVHATLIDWVFIEDEEEMDLE